MNFCDEIIVAVMNYFLIRFCRLFIIDKFCFIFSYDYIFSHGVLPFICTFICQNLPKYSHIGIQVNPLKLIFRDNILSRLTILSVVYICLNLYSTIIIILEV